jgi:outer membrane protein insertion porin family
MMLSLSPLALADFTIQDIRVEGLQRTEPSTVVQLPAGKSGRHLH